MHISVGAINSREISQLDAGTEASFLKGITLSDFVEKPPQSENNASPRGPCEEDLKLMTKMIKLGFALQAGISPDEKEDEATISDSVPIKRLDFWVKVVGMLEQNWALMEKQPGCFMIYFLDDAGNVFDEISFTDEERDSRSIRFGRPFDVTDFRNSMKRRMVSS